MKKLSVLLIVLILIGLSGCTSNAPTIKTFNAIKDGDKICVTYKVLDEKEKIKDMYLELNDTKYELDKLEDNVYLDTTFDIENKVRLVINYGKKVLKSKEICFDTFYEVKFHIGDQVPLIIELPKNSSIEVPSIIYLNEYECVAKTKDKEKLPFCHGYFAFYESQKISCIVQCDWNYNSNKIDVLSNINKDIDLYASNVSIQEAIKDDDVLYVGEILQTSEKVFSYPNLCYCYENGKFVEYRDLRLLDYTKFFDDMPFIMNSFLRSNKLLEEVIIPSCYTEEHKIPIYTFSGADEMITIRFGIVKEFSTYAFRDLECTVYVDSIKEIKKYAFNHCVVTLHIKGTTTVNPIINPNYAYECISLIKLDNNLSVKLNMYNYDSSWVQDNITLNYDSYYNINDEYLTFEWAYVNKYAKYLGDEIKDIYMTYKIGNDYYHNYYTPDAYDNIYNDFSSKNILMHTNDLKGFLEKHSSYEWNCGSLGNEMIDYFWDLEFENIKIKMSDLVEQPKYIEFSLFFFDTYINNIDFYTYEKYEMIEECNIVLELIYEDDKIYIKEATYIPLYSYGVGTKEILYY